MRRRRRRELSGQQMSFVEAVFSFVFGDGDPNWAYEERKWQQVSKQSCHMQRTARQGETGAWTVFDAKQAAAKVQTGQLQGGSAGQSCYSCPALLLGKLQPSQTCPWVAVRAGAATHFSCHTEPAAQACYKMARQDCAAG